MGRFVDLLIGHVGLSIQFGMPPNLEILIFNGGNTFTKISFACI